MKRQGLKLGPIGYMALENMGYTINQPKPKKKLEKKDIENYVNNDHGQYCPYCKSGNLTCQPPTVLCAGVVECECQCEECEKKWTELYKLNWLIEKKKGRKS